MPRLSLKTAGLAACAALFLPLPAAAELDPAALVEELRKGGLVLYIRHAQTEVDYADQVIARPEFCSTQRVLSREGWAQARSLGDTIRDLAIPVGEVLSSQYCRAWQTADLAFGRHRELADLNFEPSEEYDATQVAAMRSRVLPHLAAPVPDGANRVIVGHDDPFEAATGLYPEPQGVAVVLRPDGAGGAEILGSIAPGAWPAP